MSPADPTPDLTAVAAVADEHAARLADLDPLLPAPPPLSPGAGKLITAPAGAAIAWYQESAVGTAARTWDPAKRHNLEVRLAGADRATTLGALLDTWFDLLHGATTPGDTDSAAVLELPSRDTEAVLALVHRGFAPVSTIAARTAGRPGPNPPTGATIRPATPDDLDTLVALNLEVVEYDAPFGKVTPREDTAEALRNQLVFLLGEPRPAVWVAVRGDRVLGHVHLQLPPTSRWARRYTSAPEVAYLASLGVTAAERGTGIGSALAAHAHRVLDDEGIPVTLLHHALPNPRSTPFWYSHGYRPLWTMWLRRPVRR
ncbi:GNAT family N-acetyltransferase [Actinokineospora spheciospongiae]|uniref:GNAT family N-acetyltransferase n=1 Tax=Actinokineospora spheciospongiae TaxID=909613 RepID=UPI000D86E916|nr:GNAT family N-acetyltransferase [Actinokineospora spheciospongiae]PWW64265.1 acetyltransferase (GNAT) family protein [Actinokineospora spheciospongiae]